MDTSIQPEISAARQLAAALTDAAFARLDHTGWIRVTGTDRVRWLSGMVTNSIQSLAPGQGCYNFALNAQGRIQGDLNAFAPSDPLDMLLLETDRVQLPALMAHLDHFIIMDDVELADITNDRYGLVIVGPKAASLLHGLKLNIPDQPMTLASASWNGTQVDVIRAYSPLLARFEIWSDRETIREIEAALSGTLQLAPEEMEYLRLLEGTPRYGTDLRDTDKAHDLPQETAMYGTESRALHFAKGCYLGQEIVERIRSRGNVHRTMMGFELTGELPGPGTTLQAGDKTVGELTSVARIPLTGRAIQLALGYIRREALERKLPLEYTGGTALPVLLPFRAALPVAQS